VSWPRDARARGCLEEISVPQHCLLPVLAHLRSLTPLPERAVFYVSSLAGSEPSHGSRDAHQRLSLTLLMLGIFLICLFSFFFFFK